MTLTANLSLSPTGQVFTPILTLKLPDSHRDSHYVLTAQGDLVNFGPSDYTRCNIVVNGNTFGATPYVDANASLWAHRTASLRVGTE